MGKPMRNKGRSSRTILSVNGRIEARRLRWHDSAAGSDAPIDRLLDVAESVVSLGVRELCCRLGVAGGSFERAAGNLDQAARVKMSE